VSTPKPSNTADREIVITRLLDAPRELVFEAWTDQRHLAQWWGPRGFTTRTQDLALKPGGAWRFVMSSAEEGDFQNRIVYREIVKPERLVYTHGAGEAPAAEDFEVTVTFAEEAGRTRLTMRSVFATPEARRRVQEKFRAVEGGLSTVDRLEQLLAQLGGGEPVFVLTRLLEAPRALVFKAWTEPERLAKWWGPKGFGIRVAKLELRPGGTFLYSMRAPDGSDWHGKFVYREIAAPESLVFVNSFCDPQGRPVRHPLSPTWPLEVLNVVTFAEQGGRTALTLKGVPYLATEAEQKTFAEGRSSLVQGFTGTLDQLAAHLAA